MNEVQRKVLEMVQPHVGEQVVAAGFFSNAKLMDDAVEPRLTARKTAEGLPMNVVLAVTRSAIHVFSFGSKWFKPVVKELLTTWPRDGVHVDTAEGTMATRVALTWPDGRRVELDLNKPDRGDIGKSVIEAL